MATVIPTKGAPGQRKRTPRKPLAKKAPGKSVAVQDTKLPGDLTKAAAQRLTDKIKSGITGTIQLLFDAMEGRVWIPLGYKDWPTYLAEELGGAPLQLPTLKRREAVEQFVAKGWSTRAIAAATGTGKSTIKDDITAVQLAGTRTVEREPDLDGEPPLDVPEVPLPEPRTVNGLDGKGRTYQPPNSQPKPEALDIVVAAKKVAKALEADIVKLTALYDRDDYEENQAAVDTTLQTVLGDFATVVEGKPVTATV